MHCAATQAVTKLAGQEPGLLASPNPAIALNRELFRLQALMGALEPHLTMSRDLDPGLRIVLYLAGKFDGIVGVQGQQEAQPLANGILFDFGGVRVVVPHFWHVVNVAG